jgi:hypothetical protein
MFLLQEYKSQIESECLRRTKFNRIFGIVSSLVFVHTSVNTALRNLVLPPSSVGKTNPIQLGPLDGVNIYLQISGDRV